MVDMTPTPLKWGANVVPADTPILLSAPKQPDTGA